MDFDFTPEQVQLADTVRRLVEKDYGFEARQRIVTSPTGTSDTIWASFADLGLTALPIPEANGGFDGTAVDLLLVMQELGRGLIGEPYLATVLGAEFVKRASAAAGADARGALLESVAEGSLKLAPALGERASRYDLLTVTTTATRDGDGWVLDGRKSVVPFGAQADRLIVSARTAPGSDGLALFVVDGTADGVRRTDYRTLDGQRVAEIAFDRVPVAADALLAEGGAAVDAIEAVTDYGIALVAAEAVGVMEALNAATLEYAKTRKQFGQPIARFQVLQHRMVEMFMHLEQARSMAFLAAVKASSTDALERRRTASAAKVRINAAARFIGQQAVQIHGGMGVTNELPAAHLFKRLTMIEMALGDTDHHLQRFIAASSDAMATEVTDHRVPAPEPQPLQHAA